MTSIKALFALPLIGGAAKRTFRQSPSTPTTEVREAPGCTFTEKEIPVLLDEMLNTASKPTIDKSSSENARST